MSTADLVLTSVSRLLGWTYTLAWSLSFYPQLITNYVNGSTVGLSSDFVVLNVLGHSSYFAYNAMLYWSKDVRREYRHRHRGEQNVVQINDVVFSSHGTLLAMLTFGQWAWYTWRSRARHSRQPTASGSTEQEQQHISRTTTLVLAALSTVAVAGFGAKGVGIVTWLDIANILAGFKLFITIVKYIPQIKLNAQRKSTTGFSIENILLDLTGGTLSLLQLFLDAAIEQRHHRRGHRASRWLTTVLGDSGKLGLSVLTLGFDAVLIFQHYWLYRGQPSFPFLSSGDGTDTTATAASDEENAVQSHGTFAHAPASSANSDAQATESSSLLQKRASNTAH